MTLNLWSLKNTNTSTSRSTYGTLLQNGNWADRVCEEQHGFICKKMSALRPSGEEVEQNTGCKNVGIIMNLFKK